MQKYLTIKETGTYEQIINKSRFIATFSRIENEKQAQEFIKEVRQIHRSATHNCSAYVLGEHDEVQRAHDDGEPAGTAGVPMLESLKLMQLKNVAVVVTRYFGGIKLGAGGLIRAYNGTVSTGAKEIGIVLRSRQTALKFTISYDQLGNIDYYLKAHNIAIAHQDYGVAVDFEIFVDPLEVEPVQNDLSELLRGQVEFTVGEPRFVETLIGQSMQNKKDN